MAIVYVEAKIAEALFERVSTIPGPIPTAYPNLKFNQGDLKHLSVAHLPNGFSFEAVGQGKTYRGILQITLVEPEGRGDIQPQDEAAAVAAHFAKGSKLYGNGVMVKVKTNPTIGQSFPDDGKTRTPITIQYEASEV